MDPDDEDDPYSDPRGWDNPLAPDDVDADNVPDEDEEDDDDD
jgi:hypothetical protein